ncbi:MAG: hypothetical protein J7496_03655 [Novosphingobium sp.]|nr:hypothetical protein [Novosphingobium sp.]MBO9601588.1 hypothetical protein [Novosphingobium sp.]
MTGKTFAEMASAIQRPRRRRITPRALIDRPRLYSLLDAHDHARLIYLHAPAGYGKTILLEQWAALCAEAGDVVAWVSLDARHHDPMIFATHLDLAFSGHPEPSAQPAETRISNWQEIVRRLCDQFANDPRRCRIVIDDAQEIHGSRALACLRTLIDEAPPEMQIVIAARADTGLPLGRLRACEEILELGPEDLSFQAEETRRYLELKGLQPANADYACLLQRRSEGWIVGIKLFCMALNHEPDNRRILENFTGERSEIADFFLEDAFSRQPADIQDFLLRSSLMERFSPALCEAALGIAGSRDLIDRCEAAGLFIQRLDDTRTWYRYHQLFGEFLRRHLQDRMPRLTAPIYRRAAEWLTGTGNHVEAFHCALRGQEPMLAADILDRTCDELFALGLQPMVQSMAEKLPSHILALYPRLTLSLAWRLNSQWRFSDAKSLVAVAERRLGEMAQAPDADHALLRRLQLVVAHRSAQIAHSSYDIEPLEARCVEMLGSQPEFDSDPDLMASFHNSLHYAQREQFQFGRIDQLEARAREQLARSGGDQGLVFTAAIAGSSHLLMGQTARAKATFEAGLAVAQRISGRHDPLGAVVATALAAVHYECDEIAEARSLIDHYVPLMTSAGLVEQLLHGWITQARLHLLDNEVDAGIATLEEAAQFGSKQELDRLRIGASVEHLRILLGQGRLEEASRLARRRGLTTHRAAEATRGRQRFTVLDGEVAMACCHLMAASDRLLDALRLARQWRSFVSGAQAHYATVEWDILVAELLLLSGERLSAQRALSHALAHAAPAQLVRRFVDAREPVATLLRQMLHSGTGMERASDQFRTKLAARIDPAPAGENEGEDDDLAIFGRITNREVEILSMVASGLPNRQIGDQLGLTEGTVKWYLQQIYDKLGIRNRKLAVGRAQRLGVIA